MVLLLKQVGVVALFLFVGWLGSVAEFTESAPTSNVFPSSGHTTSSTSPMAIGTENDDTPAVVLDSQTATVNILGSMSQTVVTTEMRNTHSELDKEATFSIAIPDEAIITMLLITIDNETAESRVMEKQRAQENFERAVNAGHTAGIVKESAKSLRGMTTFSTSVNVAAGKAAKFRLVYQQILTKRLDTYELRMDSRTISKIDVRAYNADGWQSAEAPSVPEGSLKRSTKGSQILELAYNKEEVNGGSVQAKDISSDGRFVLRLRPNARESTQDVFGELFVSEDTFLHVIPAPNLPALPRSTIFLIDISGSMGQGRRMQQAREALQHAIRSMNQNDFFDVYAFDTRLERLFGEVVQASELNVRKADEFVNNLRPRGGTNIQLPVEGALNAMQQLDGPELKSIVLLTDGDPNSGLSGAALLKSVRKLNAEVNARIYTIGFGQDMKFDLLHDIAYDADGFSRRVYESTDTSEQLYEIFAEINTPVMRDVSVEYDSGMVKDVTRSHFPVLFSGSELMITGKFVEAAPPEERWVDVSIRATVGLPGGAVHSAHYMGVVDGTSAVETPWLIDATWAHQMVMQGIESAKQEQRCGSDETSWTELPAARKALNIALANNMVTPLTSLVVVLPTNGKEWHEDGPEERERGFDDGQSQGMQPLGAHDSQSAGNQQQIVRGQAQPMSNMATAKRMAKSPHNAVQYAGAPHGGQRGTAQPDTSTAAAVRIPLLSLLWIVLVALLFRGCL